MDKVFDIISYLKSNLFMSEVDIRKFASTAPHRYKSYKIPKKNGKGHRDISHPSSELKHIQSILNNKFEEIFSIHLKAMAYKQNFSIKDNAKYHLDSKYLLKLDLENFFPSIDEELIKYCLEQSNIIINDLELLLNLVLIKQKRKRKRNLTIGAPTSPIISNFIMYIFDSIIEDYCISHNIIYTRYADDLAFSSNNISELFLIESFVKNTLRSSYLGKLKLNQEKTVITHRGNNRFVTGVKINEQNVLTLGRKQKRYLYACVHNVLIKENVKNALEIQSLIGKINFFIFIQPDFKKEIDKKYKRNVIEDLKNMAKKSLS